MAAPATAAPSCGNGATLISANVCELKLTTVGASTFTPQVNTSQLEMLLVAGGGTGSQTGGYGGGGGEVRLAGFSADTTTPIAVTVGGPGLATIAAQGASAPSVAQPGTVGQSGNGNSNNSSGGNGGGGGAGASATGVDGGAGLSGAAAALAAGVTDSLFSDDTTCYGGGGAYGSFGGVLGTATCGGGTVIDDGVSAVLVAPAANSGGGGAGSSAASNPALGVGASGIVVIRWALLQDITVTFETNGRGTAVPAQTFLEGGTATRPADPTAAGYTFGGWFTDAALTTPVNFAAPLSASTTFYASWTAVAAPAVPVATLPVTGADTSPLVLPLGLGALGLGLGLTLLAKRRSRNAD